MISNHDELIRAAYNGGMSARPQFSLRMLMFVMVIVCVAAATVGKPPEDRTLGSHVQVALRNALCAALPAMLLAGAVRQRGFARSFYIGGLFPALAALWLAYRSSSYYFVNSDRQIDELGIGFVPAAAQGLWREFTDMRQAIATFWILAPCVGAAVAFSHWLLQLSDEAIGESSPAARPHRARRIVLFTIVMCGISLLAAVRAPSESPGRVAHSLLIVVLSVFWPALWAACAAHTRGCARAFCLGSSLASLYRLYDLCDKLIGMSAQWPRQTIFGPSYGDFNEMRLAWVVGWFFAPLFGAACVFFHWLFERGEAKTKRE